MNSLQNSIIDFNQRSEDYLATKRPTWTEYENILHGYLSDDLSGKAKSQMFDPKLPTISLDRSARVMAQLPTGKIKGISKNDAGGEQLMNLIVDRYILPNANAQFDFLTKCRMMDFYSNIYGNFFGLVDWQIKKDGYVGPDLWLIPIRNVRPQVGRVSLDDSDKFGIVSWKSLKYFENLEKEKGYKNIGSIVEKLKESSGSRDARSQDEKSARESKEYPEEVAAKKDGLFKIISLYERDRWVDFCVDAQLEFRDIKNPHEDGELPIVNKYSIPLIDDPMGMGDFERGKPMQYGINSLWNLYLDAVKVSIFPPVLIDEDKVSDMSSIKWAAAAKWLMKSGGVNGAQSLSLSPLGTQTFNSVYGSMTAALLNMFGTTDTTSTAETDPGFGKTPQALKMQANRENARDTADRFYMERFLTQTMKKFVNLVSKKMTGSVAIRMFGDEIEELSKSYPEVQEMFDEKTGKLNIPKSKFGSTLYDYEIVSGSTFAVDQEKQQQSLISLFGVLSNGLQVDPTSGEVTSPLIKAMAKENKAFKFGEALTRIISNSGIQDWDKIVVDTKNDIDQKMADDRQKLMMAIQAMTQAQSQVPSQPNVGQVPAQPPQGMPPQGMPQQGLPPAQMPPEAMQPIGGMPNG